jgi:hypothetical protein
MTRRHAITPPSPDPTVLKIHKVLMSAIVTVDGMDTLHTPVAYLDCRDGFAPEEVLFIFSIEASRRDALTFPTEGTGAQIAAQTDQRLSHPPADTVNEAHVEAAQLVFQCASPEDRAQLLDDCRAEWTWALQHGTLDDATHEGQILAAVEIMLGVRDATRHVVSHS